MKRIPVNPLTAELFQPFGDVIELQDEPSYQINYGMADRYHALAKVSVEGNDAFPVISLVHSRQYPLPHVLKIVERHALGSQAFIPIDNTPFVVVVGRPGDSIKADELMAFKTNGQQGINYHAGIWHGLLLTPFKEMTFVCVDRNDDTDNCEEHHFGENERYLLDLK